MTEQSITEQGATLPAGDVQDRPRSSRGWIYAALFAVVTAAIVGSVALTNYLLNPLRFSGSAMGEVASVLHAGKNYLIHDGNLDWRACGFSFRQPTLGRQRPGCGTPRE
jgi:hypothetical protein